MREGDTLGRFRSILFVVLVGLVLAGCGEKLSGTYVAAGASAAGASPVAAILGQNPYEKLEFGSGETVDLTVQGTVHRGTYKIDGKKVAITIAAQSIVLAIDDKGCLDGGQLIGKYCKK